MTGATLLVHEDFPPRLRDELTLDGSATASVRWVERLAVDAMVASHRPSEGSLTSHRLGIEFSDLTDPLAGRVGDVAAQLQSRCTRSIDIRDRGRRLIERLDVAIVG
jgi:hypothetical protein